METKQGWAIVRGMVAASVAGIRAGYYSRTDELLAANAQATHRMMSGMIAGMVVQARADGNATAEESARSLLPVFGGPAPDGETGVE